MKPVNLQNTMTRNEVRDEIKRRVKCTEYLQRAEGAGYICPKCNSGKGVHHTGALKYYGDTNTAYCHGCGSKFDVIDLIMLRHDVSYSEALEIGAAAALLPYNAPERRTNDNKAPKEENTAGEIKMQHSAMEAPKKAIDHNQYYRECIARLSDPAAVAYLNKRGISLETARRYYLGYDPKADPAESGHPTPRIIMPTSKAHYVGRSIDPRTPAAYQKMNAKGATPGIFNERYLYNSDIVFVCEGGFDALSVCEVGGEAVATNSANEAGRFIRQLREKPPAARLIICKDNDPKTEDGKETPGDRWSRIITEGLKELGIPFLSVDISGAAKDANEALTKDRATFTAAVQNALQKARKLWKAETV